MRKHPIRTLLARTLPAALLLSLALPSASAATGSQSIQVDYKSIAVTLDGSTLALADAKGNAVEPFAYQGTTYLPLRAVAGALGLDVEWKADSSTVVLTSGGTKAAGNQPGGTAPTGTTGSATLLVDYKDIKVTLDGSPLALADAKGNAVEPFAYQGTTYLPLRAVAGALGLDVAWDAATSTVALTSAAQVPAGSPAYSAAEAQRYVKGILDEWYTGAYNAQFLEDVGETPEQVQEIYNHSVQSEVDRFVSHFSIDYPEDVNGRLLELWKQLSAKASYTVGTPTGPDAGGIYTMEVTIRPLDIYQQMEDAFPAFSEQFEAAFESVNTDAMTEEQYSDWYINEYDKAYRDGLCDLLETLVPKTGYLPERTLNVRVELEADGFYGLNSEDNTALASTIIPTSY